MTFGTGALDWPGLDDLKARLDLSESEAFDAQLATLLMAAVAQIKRSVGHWDEDIDLPDADLVQAALERAVELATADEGIQQAAKSKKLLFGHRRRFGIG